jgi:nicotinate-nucleotide adenylyltransferase
VRLIRAQDNLAADDCFLILGSDSLVDLPTWHNASKLATLCRLAIIHRPGFRPNLTELEAAGPGISLRLDWVEMPPIGISSSEIRARARAGQSIRYQVVETVRKYITQHQLYRRA